MSLQRGLRTKTFWSPVGEFFSSWGSVGKGRRGGGGKKTKNGGVVGGGGGGTYGGRNMKVSAGRGDEITATTNLPRRAGLEGKVMRETNTWGRTRGEKKGRGYCLSSFGGRQLQGGRSANTRGGGMKKWNSMEESTKDLNFNLNRRW